MNRVHQVAQIAAEPVELPHDKRIPSPQCFQARRKARSIVAFPRRQVLIDVVRIDPLARDYLAAGRDSASRPPSIHACSRLAFSPCAKTVIFGTNVSVCHITSRICQKTRNKTTYQKRQFWDSVLRRLHAPQAPAFSTAPLGRAQASACYACFPSKAGFTSGLENPY